MESIWQKSVQMPSFSKLCGNEKTDVLIIGGGIAGILTAYFLHLQGVDCVLVEKRNICGGTTGFTTAKLTVQHGLIYSKLADKRGTQTAKEYLDANIKAFQKYAQLCKNIDCDYEIKDNYVYSINDRKKLEDEINTLEKIGFKAQLCDNLALPLKNSGAVRFSDQAQFNPLKFLSEISKELNIYENTFVKEIRENVAITNRGNIKADNIIVTTHFPFINKHGSYFLKLYQHRSYVIALENAPNMYGMYVDECKTGLSFRNYGKYLLLGGGSHRTGKKGGNWRELREFAQQYFPDAKEYCHWATQDCMSLDDIPYIGQYSARTSNLFIASGFNKWGMTGSMLSAMILSDMVTCKNNQYSELFSPSRNIIKPQLFVNGFEAVSNLLSFSTKRCSHLGCALKWNKAEHSWDCACHGSRFDENGKVLDNPANAE